jgi:hypothetical protein
MQQTIFHRMKRCVEESEKTGDFQLSLVLDRQVCPPVDSKLRKIVSLIGLEFTTMNRWVGRESHLVNTLISVPIAFYASHRPFASGAVPLSSEPGGGAGRAFLHPIAPKANA